MIHVHVTFLCVLSANLTNTLICSSDDTVECNGNIVKLWALNRIRTLNRNKVLYLRSEHSNASFSSILCISGIPGRNTSTVPRNLSLIIIINYLPLLLFSLPLLLLSLPPFLTPFLTRYSCLVYQSISLVYKQSSSYHQKPEGFQ